MAYLDQSRIAEAVTTFERALALHGQVPPGPVYDMLAEMVQPHLAEERHKLPAGR